jgi:cephalosporin hydroxylase
MRRARHEFEERVVRPLACQAVVRRTDNFQTVHWLGQPMWQNVVDAFMLQEAIVDCEVDLVIECGTNRGGSAFYMATIFDQLGRGDIVTIDVESMVTFTHPRIRFLVGSTVDQAIQDQVSQLVDELAPRTILVMLDSDHSAGHVLTEARWYADLVTVGSYLFVQDGITDQLPSMRHARPGPLRAIETFIAEDDRFEIDTERSERYLTAHSPSGWLRRVR